MLAQERCPDLVLADVMMPNMDGFELTRRLRQDPRTATVSIIMLTARGLSADKLEGFAIGADDYIVKPFDTPELLARIRGVLRRSRTCARSRRSPACPATSGSRRRSTAGWTRRSGVRDPVRRPRPLQGLQRPLRVHARRPGDPGRRARLIEEVARDETGGDAFVGHVGGDDFVCRGRPSKADGRGRGDRGSGSTERRPALYDPDDRDRGYIEVTNRRGELQRFPLLTISIGVASTDEAGVPALRRGGRVATEMKAVHEGLRRLVVGDRPPHRLA